jgi:curved DNA-binding protein CbpA
MGERPELSEDVDLDMETRRYVLDLYDRIDRLTHYEVLGVPRNADKKAIKRTYFRLAGLLHPDRYFSKKIGTYKPKLEAVFARATIAFEELGSADKRAKYDATLGPATASAPPSGEASAPVDPRLVARRQAAIDELTKRFEENALQAKRHASLAARARAVGDLAAATEAYEMALTYAPRDAALRAAHAELTQATAAKLGETHEKQAALEERFGQWAEAARSWQAVVAARPDDPKAKERLANARARAGLPPPKG